jgi:serine/threonine-protein kinase
VDLSGRIIDGKYELVAIAGEGGMATVYKARVRGAAGFQRAVAVKHIKPEFRALKNYIDMFIEEARVGAELAHPNIVQVHDFCSEAGSYYLVMEWVDGIDLGALIKTHRDAGQVVPWPLALAIAIGTLHGLGAAHDRTTPDGAPAPVIHRDISPHNILLGINGAVKLSDFGLARARDRAGSLTAPGTVKGKLSYLAPEVTFGKANSVQSDLFGLGSVLWETLAGERLFDGRTDIEIFKKIRACKVPPIAQRRADLPPELGPALDASLELDPARRYPTAEAFAIALGQVLKQTVGIPPPSALAAAVAAARKLAAPQPPPADNTDSLPTRQLVVDPGASRPASAGSLEIEVELGAEPALDAPASSRGPAGDPTR